MSIYTFFVLQPYAFLAHNSEYNSIFVKYKFNQLIKGHEELFMQERVIFSFGIYKSVGWVKEK